MEARTNDAWTAANRCLDAAAEYLERGEVIAAGALLRAAGRYMERAGEESPIAVRPSPPTRFWSGARQGLRVMQ